MIRRVSVFLILGALLLIPGVSPAQPALPVPTAGAAYIETCDIPIECGGVIPARFRFMGGLSLDGGSYIGTFGVNFVADEICSGLLCKLRLASAPVFRTPYPTPVIDPISEPGGDASIIFGPNISGSCAGSLLYSGIARLRCSFNTPQGLSGTRDIMVVAVDALWNAACDRLCEPARTQTEFVGIYTSNFFKSL